MERSFETAIHYQGCAWTDACSKVANTLIYSPLQLSVLAWAASNLL